MTVSTSRPFRYVRVCACSGPLFLVVSLAFWGLLGRNIPPYSPMTDAQTISEYYTAHAVALRAAMTFTMVFSVCYYLWGVAISKVMQRVEADNDVLSTIQRGGALMTTLITLLPAWIWLSAAYRPEALSPETLQLLYDMGWLLFVVAYSLTSVQMIAIGVCFLADRRDTPLFPSWMSWYSIWAGSMLIIETTMPFFRDGPLARDGVLNFWLEFGIFFLFIVLVSFFTLKAIGRLEHEVSDPAE